MVITRRRQRTQGIFHLFRNIRPISLLLTLMLLLAITRVTFLKALSYSVMGILLSTPSQDDMPELYQPKFLPLPADVQTNPSVFGQILRSEIPTRYRDESSDLLAFRDKTPRAPTHNLIIPKRFIPSIFDLTPDDLPLLYESQEMAMRLIQREQPDAYERNDYRLVFHVPPFNSVDHLHLHVLAPESELSFFHRLIKYHYETRWCVSLDRVIARLEAKRSATPYSRPKESLIALWRNSSL